MGKIIKKRIEYGGSSNSAENIKYDDTKNVKEAINEVDNLLGNTDISAIGDGTVTGGLDALNGKLSSIKTSEILWENPSPGSNFSAQNIVLSSDRYDYLKVFFRQHNVGDGGCDTQDILKGKSASLPYVTFSGGSPIICVRKIKYVDDVTLSVAAEVSNGSANQGYIVPIKIIGYYL